MIILDSPDLMHYTTAAGLSGIISSGCLWATHADFLNDAEEIKHFFDARLLDIALVEVRKYFNELAELPGFLEGFNVNGGIESVAKSNAERQVAQIRKAALSFNHPYIFSMSAANTPRVSQSGLLSQWRGYGGDGGYAVVFDREEFQHRLMVEQSTYHYKFAELGKVYYHGVDRNSQPSCGHVEQYEELVRKGISTLLRNDFSDDAKNLYKAVSSLSCLYKHWGFLEEQEMRFVAIPFDATVPLVTPGNESTPQKPIKIAPAPGDEKKLAKPVKTFLRGGMPVPYLELFKRNDQTQMQAKLPIKRVIVGPHKEALLREKAIRQLLSSNGYDAEVVCSAIPYIGR